MTKKTLIIILLFLVFCQVVFYINDRFNEEVVDGFYTGEYEDNPDNRESTWEKIKKYFNDLFKEKEERYIYK